MRRLRREFFARDALEVAPELLNKLIVTTVDGQRTVARLVEVEAYRGSEDPASHAYRGATPRNATMFGPAGHLYVYRSYGVHWCANAVTGTKGIAGAVLLRAGEPLEGLEKMRARRPRSKRDRELLAGPGRLTAALAIGAEHDGIDLVRGPIGVYEDGVDPPVNPETSGRVGISRAQGVHWRFFVAHNECVSRP